MTQKYIHTTVSALIREHHTRDPYVIARARGIELMPADLGSLRGMIQWINQKLFLFLNNTLDTQTRLLICAHELGHAVLHLETLQLMGGIQDITIFDCQHGTEAEANTFAADLLLSDRKMAACLVKGYSVEQTANMLYTTPELAAFKIASMAARGYPVICPETHANFLR